MRVQLPASLPAGLMCANQSFVFWSKPIKPFIYCNSHYIKKREGIVSASHAFTQNKTTLWLKRVEHFRCLTPDGRPSVRPKWLGCVFFVWKDVSRSEREEGGSKNPSKEATSLSLCVSADSLECLSCQSACQRASAVSGRSGERWNVSQRACSLLTLEK